MIESQDLGRKGQERSLAGEARMKTYKDRIADSERGEELELSEVQGVVSEEPGIKMMSRWRDDMRTHLAVASWRTNTKRKE